MITEDYVSFETAKLLKEKGFDNEYTNAFYDKTENLYFIDLLSDLSNHPDNDTDIAASTLYVAMKWLRGVHNYDISICLDSYVEPYDNQYYIVIRRRKDKYESVSPCEQVYFDTYEEAAEAAIKYCLEKLI